MRHVAHGIKENDDRCHVRSWAWLNWYGTAKDSVNRSPCSPPLLHLRGWHNCALKHAFTVLSAGLRHNTKLFHTRRFIRDWRANRTGQDPAWRVFAYELNKSTLQVKKKMERPLVLISPTGAKTTASSWLACSPKWENVRSSEDLWRARIADPTGTFTVYAGKYQPEAAAFLAQATCPVCRRPWKSAPLCS